MVIGLPEFGTEHQGVCRGCALGKNSKDTFPSSDNRSKEILDLYIHMCVDRCQFHLRVVDQYYMTFIDDYSRRTWIFFMKTKDEVFSRFREFKALVENQKGKKIKVLRSEQWG
jgi:hypothetical protein